MPDDKDKVIKIPIRITNNTIRYYYGGDLPKFSDVVIGDLIVPEFAVKDKKFISIIQAEQKYQILDRDTILMMGINGNDIPSKFRPNLNEYKLDHEYKIYNGFVSVYLKEPLFLQYRGSKMPTLSDANCHIEALKKDAISLNNAFTIISEEFETSRKSHTGNVFDKCFYKSGDGKWYPIKKLREHVVSLFEESLVLDYKTYKLKNNNLKMDDLKENEIYVVGYLIEYKTISGKKIKELYKDKKDKKFIEIVNSLLDKNIICEVRE